MLLAQTDQILIVRPIISQCFNAQENVFTFLQILLLQCKFIGKSFWAPVHHATDAIDVIRQSQALLHLVLSLAVTQTKTNYVRAHQCR